MSWWLSRGIDDNNGCVGGGIWDWGLDNDAGGIGGGRRRDDAPNYSGTTMEAVALRLQSWGIGDNNRGVYRGRWSRVRDDNDGGVGGGIRRGDAPEWTSTTAESAVCLRVQVIYDDNSGVGGVRQDQVLSNNDGGFGGGRRINDASKGSETTAEAVED